MKAIYKRDLLSYFRGIGGYLFFTLYMLVCGYVFTLDNIIGSSGSLSQMYKALGILFVIAVPFLTVKNSVDGRDLKTEQLLYVSAARVVLSKFAAVMSLIFGAIMLSWIYFGILSIFARPYITEAVMCQAGLLLLCSCLTSLTAFISSIAHRKMQAYVMIFTLVLVFFVANNLITLAGNTFYQRVFHVMGLFSCYSNFMSGIFSPLDLIYMLSFTAVFLCACCIMTDRKRVKGA